ncbi:hypothetical protein HZA99_00265 [Candidatus Woesearchaeota archaeon]|nr:hypothetical protein [Candidatus Woesearchaeota archaeon]
MDLEPPKPTKEFHDAYLEIYGKGKKKADKLQTEISFDKPKKSTMDDLSHLDIPPIKINSIEKMEPLEKKRFFGLFGKKKQEAEQKEFSSLADLDLPPLKAEEHKELIDGEPVDLTSFSKEEQGAMNELDKLDLPPQKIGKELPQFTLDIEPPISKPLPRILPAGKAKKQQKTERPIHDFLAEIKFGAKKELETQKEFQREAQFEKEKTAVGARDLQTAYEKTHRFETGGFEYMEPIQPIQKTARISFSEELEMPEKPMLKASEFKSPAEFKKHMTALKQWEQQAKKTAATFKKKQQEAQVWLKKQEVQEKKINEKMRKMQIMKQELQEKQRDVMQYEPKMQALWRKEDDIAIKEASAKQKLQDAQETETRIRTEEDAIVAKIKKLETDQKRLEKEEDAVAKTVAKLDKDRAVISAKTREFTNIVKEIGNAEKELKEKSQLLDDREERMKRKEKLVETEFARIERLKKTAERLKDVEETYARVKERLRLAYKEYEEKFSNQQAYAPQEIRAVPIQPTFQPVRSMPEAKAVDSGDITNLMTATKQLIMNKEYEEANKNINRLMQRYTQIADSNPRKKEIYYEIVGLKNMLKLDLLE